MSPRWSHGCPWPMVLRCVAATLAAAALQAVSPVVHAQTAPASVRLADVIKSSGSGRIDLMRASGNVPIAAAALEAYRLDHVDTSTGEPRHYLALGIDVNENNKGMEQSTAQGITIAAVTLTVVRPTGTTTYTGFRTATRALVAPAGSTTRASYATALGEGGSSRITARNAIQAQFDSTLDLFVPDRLDDASSAVLEIRLLAVNTALGDPESFYDFSGGFEDLALLDRADAYYLNVSVPAESAFRQLAPAVDVVSGIVSNDTAPPPADPGSADRNVVGWSHYPSASGWYTVAYEDNFPDRGDYDFNDAVVAYRYRLGFNAAGLVVRVEAESYLVSDGATYTLDWQFRLPVAGTGVADCQRRLPGGGPAVGCASALQGGTWSTLAYPDIDNSGALFGAGGAWATNTPRGSAARQGARVTMSLMLDTPVDPAVVGAADPALFVHETGRWVDGSSRDARGYPYALTVPAGWRNPFEYIDMGLAYPHFRSFVESGGSRDADWFLRPDPGQVFDIGGWQW